MIDSSKNISFPQRNPRMKSHVDGIFCNNLCEVWNIFIAFKAKKSCIPFGWAILHFASFQLIASLPHYLRLFVLIGMAWLLVLLASTAIALQDGMWLFQSFWACIKKQKNLQQQVSSKQFFFWWDLFSKFKRFDKNEYNGEFLLRWRFQKTTWIRSLISNLQQILGTSKLRSLFGTSKIRWWR